MSADDIVRRETDDYLRRFEAALRGLPSERIDDIVAEIRSHLEDIAVTDAGLDPRQLHDALLRLGDPAELAEGYRLGVLAARAEGTRSPLLLLRTVATWASMSAAGLWSLLIGCAGYLVAALALACAAFKPFIPGRIGLWRIPTPDGDTHIQLGRVVEPAPGAQELLGAWIIPIGIIVGLGALILTTRFLSSRIRQLRGSGPQRSRFPAA